MSPHSNSRAAVLSEQAIRALGLHSQPFCERLSGAAARILNRQVYRSTLAARLRALPLRMAVGMAVAAIAISLLLFVAVDAPDDETVLVDQSVPAPPTTTTAAAPTGFSQAELTDSERNQAGIDETNSSEAKTPTITQQFAESHGIRYFPTETPASHTKTMVANAPSNLEKNSTRSSHAQQPKRAAQRKLTTSEYWLLKQDPSAFTIQLLASYNREALTHYARNNKIESQTALYESSRDARRWFVLTYGLYANAQTAHAAISTLPGKLRRNVPWVRSLESIHQAINQSLP